jgi:energy-coupling factor transport system ATP-binding protein
VGVIASVERLGFRYPGARVDALADVTLELRAGETVVLLGPSGSGKSTLLRALAGLVPHFHGGRFRGLVEVGGRDTRRHRPAELAGTVASVFQDPEDQIVMTRVAGEVGFGLENLGVAPEAIAGRVEAALDTVGAGALAGRRTTELSAGELQRVCLAAALALEPSLLLLDEPTSQLDADGAERFLDAVAALGVAAVVSEHRTHRVLPLADRVLFVEGGRLLLDAPLDDAISWLAEHRPAYVPGAWADDVALAPLSPGAPVVAAARSASFAYGRSPVLRAVDLEVRRGEIVAIAGPNGAGKTTLARMLAGLLEPASGRIERTGRAGYLGQDPGRHLVCDRAVDEVALSVGGDRERALAALAAAGLAWSADRHPRDLSSGERERLALAAVAVAAPDLLVLDEPTRGVDPERKLALARSLASLARRGHAVAVVTHDPDFPAHRRVVLEPAFEGASA